MAVLVGGGVSYKEWWEFAIKPAGIMYVIGILAITLAIIL